MFLPSLNRVLLCAISCESARHHPFIQLHISWILDSSLGPISVQSESLKSSRSGRFLPFASILSLGLLKSWRWWRRPPPNHSQLGTEALSTTVQEEACPAVKWAWKWFGPRWTPRWSQPPGDPLIAAQWETLKPKAHQSHRWVPGPWTLGDDRWVLF